MSHRHIAADNPVLKRIARDRSRQRAGELREREQQSQRARADSRARFLERLAEVAGNADGEDEADE
jgi:hypothetical protein